MKNRAGRVRHVVVGRGAVALVAALTFAVAMPAASPVRAGLSSSFAARQVEQIGAGVTFSSGLAYTEGNLRQSVDVASIDADSAKVRIRPLLSNDMVAGRERPTSVAARHNTQAAPALVAINGDFWWPGHGSAPRGLHVQNGEVMAAGPLALPTLGIDDGASLRMAAVKLDVTVNSTRGTLNVSQVNGGRRPGELVLYTPRVGFSTRTDGSGTEVLLAVNDTLHTRDTMSGTVLAVMRGSGNTPLASGQMVLSGTDGAAQQLGGMAPGQQVTIVSRMSDSAWDGVDEAIGGDQFLVRHGALTALASANHPRTAIGLTAAGDLLMVTVDGRKPGYSYGVTASEMGQLMRQFGAVDAINFDGGGSTTMAVRAPGADGLIVANSPSDGHQRAVTSSLVVFAASTRQPVAASVDTTPPTTPEGLNGYSLPLGRTLLTWRDSRDDTTSMLRFALFRDGQYLGMVVTTTFVDRRLTGSHSYTVRAVDAAGNASAAAPTVVVRSVY